MFEGIGIVEIFNRSTPQQGLERSAKADIIVVNKFKVTESFLEACPNIKLVCVAATGYNNIDMKAVEKRGIKVCNVAGYSTDAVAQHVFALLLHILNNVSKHNRSVKKGFWSVSPDFSFTIFPIQDLAGKTMGIYGYGTIARAVAKVALAFNMKVIAYSRKNQSGNDGEIRFVNEDTLLSESDVLTLHAALNKDSAEFINQANISKMKDSCILINTGRGGLINEADLADALMLGELFAAGLDVLSEEPAPLSHPFYKIKNCVITPHMAWGSINSRKRLLQETVNNINAFLNGTPQNLLN